MTSCCVGPSFCGVVLGVQSIAIALLRKRELVALFSCVVAVCALCLFLAVPWVALRSVIVVFPGHTHLIFEHHEG